MIAVEQDVFAVRRQGRQLAAALGFEEQDQVRIAAALSEAGRRMLADLGPVAVDFRLTDAGRRPTAPCWWCGPRRPARPTMISWPGFG